MTILELVMIVKNSGKLLQKTLDSIKNHINYWTILDTGSIDSTPELIQNTLKHIPGKLHKEPFVDFLTTRNRSLELSTKKCKYIIILDDSYILQNPDKLVNFLKYNDQDYWNIKIVDDTRNTAYFSTRIIKSKSGKKYEKYKVHEAIPDTLKNPKQLPLECYISDLRDSYHNYRSNTRHYKDIEIMNSQLQQYPKDTRILYYLAKTYEAMNNKKKAYKTFEKIKELGNLSKENELFEALLFIANYKYQVLKKDWTEVEKDLFEIIKKFRYRIEPLFLLFNREYNTGNITRAYQYIKLCSSIKEPENYPFEYNYMIYRLYVPYFYIHLSLKLGNIEESIETLKNVLKVYPDDQRFLNIKYSITEKKYVTTKLSENKTIVIHTGNEIFEKSWSPHNLTQNCSGSEIMAIFTAKTLTLRGYRVFLFGHFTEESVWEGVEYYKYQNFNEFISKYEVDCLIVSRWARNLVYNNNVKKVYLWCHDVFPQDADYTLQTHSEKFKGILCLSEWQRDINIKEYNLPKHLVHLYSNAIYTQKYLNKKIQKIPHRFIWTSDMFRGLPFALEMFKEIHKKYPKSTFVIIGNSNNLQAEWKKEIDETNAITFKSRMEQDDLITELLQSEVWLYPNNFEETYCISAVEAQMAKCLVCCNVHAGLKTTVEDRGAVIQGKYSKDKLLTELYRVLENKEIMDNLIAKGLDYAKSQDFENVIDNLENRFIN